MIIQNYLDRPGIHVVDDAHELNSIAGGAGNSTLGDAELEEFMETRWIKYATGIVLVFYAYGNPTHRARIQKMCRQLESGVNNAGRDSLNIIYKGIAGASGVATWIKSYFTAAADSTSSATATICPDPPDGR
jgi:hypothetical protein